VLAAAAPRTRKEDELMGGARDQLMNKASEVASEQLGNAKASATKEKEDENRPQTGIAKDKDRPQAR
jgi:hypothetical protein